MSLQKLADGASAAGSEAIFIGVAGIITAFTGLVGACAALIRVLRAPERDRNSRHDDEDEDFGHTEEE